jgi:aminopeptidase N
VLALLVRHDPLGGAELAFAQYRDTRGMTDRLVALSVLARSGAAQAADGLRLYRQRFDGDALTLDKWFMLQATVPDHATLERVQALEADPAFTLANPNRVHALLGALTRGNPVAFHRPDGAAHRWFAGKLAEIDARNPQLSARLAKAFEDWPRLEPVRRASARSALRELLARGQHSPDLGEILGRMLAAGDATG